MFRKIALIGLKKEENKLLRKLLKMKRGCFKEATIALSEGEDYIRANMFSSQLGAEVLERQIAREKKEKTKTYKLIKKCIKSGISKWRIRMVTS